MSHGSVEYLDHMTDAYLRIHASNLGEAFEYAGLGLVGIMYELEGVEPNKQVPITAEGKDLENLLFDWLDKILLIVLLDRTIMSEFRVKITHDDETGLYGIRGYGNGEQINPDRHELKVEVKGITYHEMKILENTSKGEVMIEYIVDL
ncbi:archease [Candidatus Nitrosocosmicus hydrocola]|jgi:SHS2 domain-containing protein|uniref:archease n=1 Tax=Candidatus Nitrosocosmicus hydrocola TaxID=1826872 RepID=UPI0011E5F142|nr:archease [Candidatus Nitrosocosmicus hydrocola]